MERRRLSDTRAAVIHKIDIVGVVGYIRVGLFDDGTPGEIFINMNHSDDVGPWGVIGILISMALQRGVPLRDIVKKLAYTRFEPMGVTGNKDLRMATSIADYIVRWMWLMWGDGSDPMQDPIVIEEKVATEMGGS